MAEHAASPRVLAWPVEPGSATEVPIRLLGSGEPVTDDSAHILWCVGFCERDEAAATVAQDVQAATGVLTTGVVLPFPEVVEKASNVKGALDYLIKDALHYAAREVAGDRPPLFAGNSRGGVPAVVAATTGTCEAVAALSPLGVTNRTMGAYPLRGLVVASRLAVFTAFQNRSEGVAGQVVGGLWHETRAMRLRLFAALGYALSDYVEDMFLGSLVQLRQAGRPAAIFCPTEDIALNASGYPQRLAAVGCADLLYSIDGPHTHMASPRGRQQAGHVARWLTDSLRQRTESNGHL